MQERVIVIAEGRMYGVHVNVVVAAWEYEGCLIVREGCVWR